MKYMLLIYSKESSWTREQWEACVEKSSHICDALVEQKKFIDASPLYPVNTAKTVRVPEGKVVITSGPFAETSEQLGGYFLLNVESIDEAISTAEQLPGAERGYVEIRELVEIEGLPESCLEPPAARSHQEPLLKRFMLLCYDDEKGWQDSGKEVHNAAMLEAVQITQELASQGRFIDASPLHFSSTAVQVQRRDGKTIISHGPFAETHEVLGGFYQILAHDHEEALNIAKRHPGARIGAVEVREIVEVREVIENAIR